MALHDGNFKNENQQKAELKEWVDNFNPKSDAEKLAHFIVRNLYYGSACNLGQNDSDWPHVNYVDNYIEMPATLFYEEIVKLIEKSKLAK